MAMNNLNISRAGQSLAPGNRVELYQLDLRPLGMTGAGAILYFSPTSIGDNQVVFGGKTYSSVPIQATGFDLSGTGPLPQPLLRIVNVNNIAASLAKAHRDLIGAILTRTVTFRQFLDDGATPDALAMFPSSTWEVVQKAKSNKLYIEWKLASFIDRNSEQLPKRKVWKRFCLWPYRVWDAATATFDYSNVQGCSYTGGSYFKADGTPTAAPAEDACGKHVEDCKLRFGSAGVLPYGGFIGAAPLR